MRLLSSWIPWAVLVLASITRAEHNKKHGIQEAEERTFYQGGWIPMVAPCPTCRKRDTSQETQDFPSHLADFHHPPPPPLAQMLQDFSNFKSHHIKTPLGTGTEILGSTVESEHRGREPFSSTDDINLLRFHQSRGLLMPHLHMPHASQLISSQSRQVPIQPFVSDLSTLRTHTGNQQDFIKNTENDEKENQNKEVQLLYVPVETLKERYNEKNKDNKESKQRQNVVQQTVSPSIATYTTENQLGLQETFIPQTTAQGFNNNNFDHAVQSGGTRHRFYNQHLDQPTHDTTTNKSSTSEESNLSTKLKAHTPPLSVFMDSNGETIKVSDVVRILKDANTIAVLDHVGPDSPNIFIGPSNLNTPSYTKFELPYLSSIDSNRVERKVERLPFFVAPLNFKPPHGYSKIPLPAPHVGSVVIKQETAIHKGELPQRSKPQFTTPTNPYSLPLDLLPINPELPSLVNSLQETNQDDVLLVPDTENSNVQSDTSSYVSSSSTRPFPTVPTRQHHSTLQPTQHFEVQTEPVTLHSLPGRVRNPVQSDTHHNRVRNKQQPNYNTQTIHSLTQTKTHDTNEDSKTNEQIVLNTKVHPKTKIVNFFSLQNNTNDADSFTNTENPYGNEQLSYKNIKSLTHQPTSEKIESYNQHTLSPQLETVTGISPDVQHFSVGTDYYNKQVAENSQYFTENKNTVQPLNIFSHDSNEYVQRVPSSTTGQNLPIIKDEVNSHQKEVSSINSHQKRVQPLNSQFYFPNLQQSELLHVNTETANLQEEPTNTEAPKTYSQHINQVQAQPQQIQEPTLSTTSQTENEHSSTISPSTVFPNRRQKQRSRTRSTSTTTPSSVQTTPSSRRTNSRSRRPTQTRTRVQNKETINKASVSFEETKKPQTFNNEQNAPSINDNVNQQHYTTTEQQNINYRISTEDILSSDPHAGFGVHQPTHSMLNGFISTSQPSYHYNVFHSNQPQQLNIQQSETEPTQTEIQDTTTITNSPKSHRFRGRQHPQRLSTYSSLQTPVTENLLSTDVSDSVTHAGQNKRVISDIYSQRTALKDNDRLYFSQITTEPVQGFIQTNNSRNLNVNLPETNSQSQFYQHQQVPFEQSQFPVYEQEHTTVNQRREKIKTSHLNKPNVDPSHETTSLMRHGVQEELHQNQYTAVHQNQNLATERNPITGFTASQLLAIKTENPTVFYPGQQVIYPHQQTTLRIQPVYSQFEQTTPHERNDPSNSESFQEQNHKQVINMHGFIQHQTAETPVVSEATLNKHPVFSAGQVVHTSEHLLNNAQPKLLYSVSPSTQQGGNLVHISNNRNAVQQNPHNYTTLVRNQQQNDPNNIYFSGNFDTLNNNQHHVNSDSSTIHNRAHEVTSPATIVSLPLPETSASQKPISHMDITTFRNMLLLHTTQAVQATPRTRTRTRVRHRDQQNRNHDDSKEFIGSQRIHNSGQISNAANSKIHTPGSNINTGTFYSSTDASNFQGLGDASREKYSNLRQFSPRYRTTSEEVSDSNTETSVLKNQRTLNKISNRPPSLPITQENTITTTTESSNKVYTIRPTKRTNLPTKIQSTRGRIRKPTSTTTTTTSAPTTETTSPSYYNKHPSTITNFQHTNANKIYVNQNEIQQQGSLVAYTPEQISRFSDSASVSPKYISPFRNYNLNDYQGGSTSQYNNQDFTQNSGESSSEDYSLYDQQRYESSVRSLVYDRSGLSDQNVQESKWFAGPNHSSKVKKLTEENTSLDRSSEYSVESTTEYNNDYTKYDNSIESSNESNEKDILSFENMPKPFTLPDETTSKSDTYSYTIIHDENPKSVDKAASKHKNRRKGTWVRVAVKPHRKDVLETAESQNVASFSNNVVPTAPIKKQSLSNLDGIYNAPTTPAMLPQTVQPKDLTNVVTTTEMSDDDFVSTTIEPTKYPNHKYDSDENVDITIKRNKYENRNKENVDIWNMSNYTNNNNANSLQTNKSQTNKVSENETENEQTISTTESSAEYILTTEVPIVTTATFIPEVSKSEEDIKSSSDEHTSSEESGESFFDYLGNIFGNREEPSSSTKEIYDRNDQYSTTEKHDKKNKTFLKDKKYDKEKLNSKEETSTSKPLDKYSSQEIQTQHSNNKDVTEKSQEQNRADSNLNTEENKNSGYNSDPLMSAEIQEMMAKVANFDSTESTVPTIDFDIQKTKAVQKPIANLTSPNQPQILGTSTSTEISHETEICYRGRCIKTKTLKTDEDEETDDILAK